MGHLLLGVTGGVATGKSAVTDMLKEMGAPTIDFDRLARIVERPGQPAYLDIVEYFGKGVLLGNGELDRKELSKIVFADPAKRKKLESFTHPRIAAEYTKQMDKLFDENADAVIQVMVPLLIETGLQHIFDKILLVYAPEDVQLRRLMRRDRISEQRARNIIASQMPIEEKRSYADYIIDNSGTLEQTRLQVEELWKKLATARPR